MDCLKNLTACLGCTKKHAKCSWKEVTDQELIDNPHVPRAKDDPSTTAAGDTFASGSAAPLDGPPQPVRDEELLGEEEDSDDDKAAVVLPSGNGVSHENEPAIEQGDSNTPRTARSQTPTKSAAPEADIGKVRESVEDVQAAAREILKKRHVEIPGDRVTSGFQPASRPNSEYTPEGSPVPRAPREASVSVPASAISGGDGHEKQLTSVERSQSPMVNNQVDKAAGSIA